MVIGKYHPYNTAMLRIAVISLFVANLLLFAFKGKEPPVQEKAMTYPAAVEDSNIPTIHLFNEMVQDQDLMSDNRRCFSLGPFHSSEEMDELRGQLDEVSANISERQTQALVEKGFWVFLPPHESLLEANEVQFSFFGNGMADLVPGLRFGEKHSCIRPVIRSERAKLTSLRAISIERWV